MTTSTLAGILYVVTALIHFSLPFIYDRRPPTPSYARYGAVYLAIGVALLLTSWVWVPIIAILLTIYGGGTAVKGMGEAQFMRPMIYFLLVLDVIAIVLLLMTIFGS